MHLTKSDKATIRATIESLCDGEDFEDGFTEVPMETVMLSTGYADVYATGQVVQYGVTVYDNSDGAP
jgi:hypothetical protein